MKAAVCERYGPPEVVRIREVPTPVPGAGEILVRSAATTVNSGDARVRALRVPRGLTLPVRLQMGWSKPRQPIFGFDVAGTVEQVGDEVTAFRPGDRVVTSPRFFGRCHAEYVTAPADGAVAAIPGGLGDEDAVALAFGGTTALSFFRKGKLASGESVVVNGASGAVGTMAVQLAKQAGAEVTAVCSAANADLVAGLGADRVVDYAHEDFTADGRRYDVIMDNHGNAPYSRIKGSLAPGGRFLMVVGDLWQMIAGVWQRPTIGGSENDAGARAQALRTLTAGAVDGSLRPVIDSVVPFDEIVEAHRRVDGGHKVGSLVVRFAPPG
jgi:NADPH:quinone reductase-like Zn-dependent oxidoreductase